MLLEARVLAVEEGTYKYGMGEEKELLDELLCRYWCKLTQFLKSAYASVYTRACPTLFSFYTFPR